ncbi:hypothetical protein F4604DRAFT_898739 [Suillus subluteus]|nr:hypothetical protein F4604DRAFT_898739 [Suillus subluteus]
MLRNAHENGGDWAVCVCPENYEQVNLAKTWLMSDINAISPLVVATGSHQLSDLISGQSTPTIDDTLYDSLANANPERRSRFRSNVRPNSMWYKSGFWRQLPTGQSTRRLWMRYFRSLGWSTYTRQFDNLQWSAHPETGRQYFHHEPGSKVRINSDPQVGLCRYIPGLQCGILFSITQECPNKLFKT